MAILPGKRLGPYEILSLIGAGGMGEVYRAKDTRLNRIVAIKVLPSHLADSSELRERFEREARTIASLNHPHICTLHDIGHQDGTDFLVMEYLEGETLAQRLVKGALPLDQVLQYAIEIADALDKAHRKGVTHRDLKPGNIMLTKSGTKLLDFGLAKLKQEVAPANVHLSQLPTANEPLTAQGSIVGTLQYMAPEQLEGKEVGARTDIFAFGAVVYEMATGKRAFEGKSQASVIGAILKDDPPPMSSLSPMTPPSLDRVVKRCLTKEPEKRWQTASDLCEELKWIAEGGSQAGISAPLAALRKTRRGRLLATVVAIAVVMTAALIGALMLLWPRTLDRPLMRLSVDLGPDAVPGVNITASISPDGTRLVFPALGPDGKQRLATRLLDQAIATLLPGTEHASDPFFSPDGQWVGFFADGEMKKISVQGGAPIIVCEATAGRGASWGEDGNIIAALSTATGLSLVPSSGGVPQQLTKLEHGELTHRWPQVLPGGNAVLFTASSASIAYENASIEVLSLKTGERKTLLQGGYFGRYLPTNGPRGHLVYSHQGSLFGVAFDPVRLELSGTPTPLLDDLACNPLSGTGQLDFSSKTGILVYRSGQASDQAWPVVWLDSSGKTEPLVTKADGYTTPRFSPDGFRLALAVAAGAAPGREIHIYDLRRDTMSRLVFNTPGNFYPIWSPDGKHIAFRSPSSSGSTIEWIRADGSGDAQRLLESKDPITLPYSFSPDGQRLAYSERSPETGYDLWTLPLDTSDPDHPKPGKPELFLKTSFNQLFPAFSPDGHWMAYASDKSGRFEVYVRRFPGPGNEWQISTGGGQFPIWSRNGRDVFFESPENRIMVADYTATSDSFVSGKPRVWSEKQIRDLGSVANLDLAPDGKRFAMLALPEATKQEKGSVRVTFLLNFFDEVRRRIPERK